MLWYLASHKCFFSFQWRPKPKQVPGSRASSNFHANDWISGLFSWYQKSFAHLFQGRTSLLLNWWNFPWQNSSCNKSLKAKGIYYYQASTPTKKWNHMLPVHVWWISSDTRHSPVTSLMWNHPSRDIHFDDNLSRTLIRSKCLISEYISGLKAYRLSEKTGEGM